MDGHLPKGLFVPVDQGVPVSRLAALPGKVWGRCLSDLPAEAAQGLFEPLFRRLGLFCSLLQALHLLLPLLTSFAGFASNRLRLDVSHRCLKLAQHLATAGEIGPRHQPLRCLLGDPSCPARLAEVPDERLDVRCRGLIFVIWSATAEPFSRQMLPQALVHGTGGAPM